MAYGIKKSLYFPLFKEGNKIIKKRLKPLGSAK